MKISESGDGETMRLLRLYYGIAGGNLQLSALKGRSVDLKLLEKDYYLQFFRWTQDWRFVGKF